MSQEIVLYDLPSQPPLRSWSANVWRTRLALNYKNLPYKTEWVNYIRLPETLKATGLKPNPPGSWSDYTVPTICLPDGSYIMDSAAIALKLESLYPTPSLHLNAELEEEANAALGAVFMALVLYIVPLATKQLVDTQDVDWFRADRAQRFGITVEELEREKDPDAAFAAAKPGFEKCRIVLTSHKKDQGPFILGSQVSYADFHLMCTMQMFRQAGLDFFEKFMNEAGQEMKDLYSACERWTVKQT